MRQYLSHRRRLCDKANQVHPPAAPGELERKHPVDARQQVRPRISRQESAPRSAAVCTHCLWPRWLTPRSQLPPGLRRHQFPPRRVRCQHPKVAVRCLRGGSINNATRSRKSLALSHSYQWHDYYADWSGEEMTRDFLEDISRNNSPGLLLLSPMRLLA